MATLQQIMFLQGQLCFFCNRTIPQGDASLEHLVPLSDQGPNRSDNVVACCKSLNALFGNMSIKEKISAILKQNGKFACPNLPKPTGGGQPAPSQPSRIKPPAPEPTSSPAPPAKHVVADFISQTPDGSNPGNR